MDGLGRETMTKLFGAALMVAALGIGGCEDRKDLDSRDEAKKELKELQPGNQTMEERAEKARDEVKDAGDDVKRQGRNAGRELREGARDAER